MKLIFSAICVFFAVVCMPVFADTTCVQNAKYHATGLGMNLMSMSFEKTQNKTDFSVLTHTQTQGMLSVVLDSKVMFKTTANIKNNQYNNIVFSINGLSSKKTKNRTVSLADKTEFLDYQTAVAEMMKLSKPQDKTFKIYDGRREMIFDFHYLGVSELPAGVARFGMAHHYTLTITVTGGKKSGWFFNRVKDKSNPPLHIYFAEVPNQNEKVMAYAYFDTSIFGQINVYLDDVKTECTDATNN